MSPSPCLIFSQSMGSALPLHCVAKRQMQYCSAIVTSAFSLAVPPATDNTPLDSNCTCPACAAGFTRGYIHHLVRQREMTGAILLSLHNINYLLDLMRRARAAIIDGSYGSFVREWESSPAVNDF